MFKNAIRCNVIAPDAAISREIIALLSNLKDIEPTQPIDEYPDLDGLRRIMRFDAPQLLLIDCSDLNRAISVISAALSLSPELEVVAVAGGDATALTRLIRAGVRDYFPCPLTRGECWSRLETILQRIERKPRSAARRGGIVTFLPAKPGDGASTLAVNASIAGSKVPESRNLLVDFDINAGSVRFLLNCRHDYFLGDALNHAYEMDASIWSRLKGTADKLDFLASEPQLFQALDTDRVSRLLDFFAGAYDLTSIDLSGNLDPASMEVLRNSKRIYMVCTQDLSSQHQLCRKAALLRSHDLTQEIRVIINRYDPKRGIDAARVEQISGLKVEMTMPNDYRRVTESIEAGWKAFSGSALGERFNELAERMVDRKMPKPQGRKFMDLLFRQERYSGAY